MSNKVSILICTRNRADDLRETLKSVLASDVPAGWDAEFIVIDNGSTDPTRAVVSNASAADPRLRHVFEECAGLGNARNRGLREAAGDVVLFTDDDVRVAASWIEGMCGPILRGETDAVAGAVKIAPHLERPWLQGEMRGWLASSDVIDLRAPDSVVGANMAFARKVIAKVPAFDPELGAGASGYFEEALFWRQLRVAGFNAVGRPEVVIEHHFDASRLDPQSFIPAARKLGKSWAYVHYHWEHGRIRLGRLKSIKWAFKLGSIRRKSRGLAAEKGGVSPALLNAEFQRSLVDEFRILKRKGDPPHYNFHGLAKRATRP